MKATLYIAALAAGLGGLGLVRTAAPQDTPDDESESAEETVTEEASASLELVEPPPGVTIREFRASGRGCPSSGSSLAPSASISEDSSTLALALGDFVARVGPGVPVAERSKSCTAVIDLAIPEGYSVSVSHAAGYHGHASLGRGVTGRQDTRYGFIGQAGRYRHTVLYGASNRDYARTDVLDADAVWSLCGVSRPMRVTLSVAVSNMGNPRGAGTMGLDARDLEYTLAWRRCS